MINLVIIADPGKALDDEEMFVLLSRLTKLGLCRASAVVTNLAPAGHRARLTRGTLDLLSLADVSVGIGSEVVATTVQSAAELESATYFARDTALPEGQSLLRQALTAAEDGSVTLLLVSAMTDANAFLLAEQALFLQKVKRVVIMGGVISDGTAPRLDDGFLLPDCASNNHYDMPAAESLYRRLQQLKVPLVILTRNAGYATKVPRLVYQKLAATGHPVGIKLSRAFEQFINDFWIAVNAAAGDSAREGLPARWNRDLFLDTFCGGKGQERTARDSVLDLVEHVCVSDPMTLIAAIPSLSARFYVPCKVSVLGIEHEVIGISPDKTCVADTQALVDYLVENLVGGLTDSVPPATATSS